MTTEDIGESLIIPAHFSVHLNSDVAAALWRFQAG